MYVNRSLLTQKPQILREARVVLPTADQLANLGVQGLNPDLKLQRPRRETGDDLPQRVGKSIRNHFEMGEEARTVTGEKELQNGPTDVQVQVERAIDKLELPHTALQ